MLAMMMNLKCQPGKSPYGPRLNNFNTSWIIGCLSCPLVPILVLATSADIIRTAVNISLFLSALMPVYEECMPCSCIYNKFSKSLCIFSLLPPKPKSNNAIYCLPPFCIVIGFIQYISHDKY